MKIQGILLLMILMVGSPVWAGGGGIYCTDYQGAKVIWENDSFLDEMTVTLLTFNATPVIKYNSAKLSSLDATTREFVMARQCGVHVLGFMVTRAEDPFDQSNRSQLADCWSASKLFYGGKASRSDLESLQTAINSMSRKEWLSFPGPVRVVDFESCELKDM
ncbi:MAG TPA: hypothetical protein DCM60_02790 [Nitrospina sp.]|jgi:hypothetical protein|nr:hypothetical protein [Nitrospina sp.]|tara:strand:+ start:2760 stop:3245 length:486 start_codon:yes stop_codon:yes gene_type:complete